MIILAKLIQKIQFRCPSDSIVKSLHIAVRAMICDYSYCILNVFNFQFYI